MNNNTGYFATIARELRLIKGRKSFLLGMIIIPILSITLFLATFGDSSLHNMPIAVVDNDHSPISRQLIQMIDATPGVAVKYNPSSVEEGEELMLNDKVEAVLYIPKGLEKNIYHGVQSSPTLYINSMRVLNSSLVYRDVVLTSQMMSIGIERKLLASGGKSASEAEMLSMPVYYEKHTLFNPFISYGYYLVSPFNMLTIILLAITYTLFSFGLEKKEGIFENLKSTAGGNSFVAVIGKMSPYTIYFTFCTLVSNFILYAIVKTPFDGSIWLLSLNCFLTIVAYQSLGLIFYVIVPKLMVAMSFSAAISTMSFTMSGLTFPLMAMNSAIYSLAHIFPFTHYMYAYIAMIRGVAGIDVLPHISILLIYPVILLMVIPQLIKILGKPFDAKL